MVSSETEGPSWRAEAWARRSVYVWAAVLGLEVGQTVVPNFRLAIGDALLVTAGLFVLAGGRWIARLRALPRRPLIAITSLCIAIAVGLVVDEWRYGFIIREAWFNKGVGVLLLVAIVGVVGSTIRTAAQAITLIRAYLAGALVTTVVAFLLWAAYWLGVAPEGLAPFGVRFVGFLLSPNAAAIYFSIGLVLSIGAAAGAPYGAGPWKAWLAASALFLGAVVLTLSRSTWVAIFAASVLLLFCLPRRRALPAVAAIVLLVLLTPALQAAVGPTVEQLVGSGAVSFLRRDEGTAPFPLTTPSPGQTTSPNPSVVAASSTRPPGGSPATTSPPATPAALTAGPTASPQRTFLPTALPTSPPEPSHASPRDLNVNYFENAGAVATDPYGFNDRIFIDVIALRLWRQDAGTLVTGIGLEGFPLLALSTELAEPVDIHSSYMWLPVEMGLAGIIALGTILGVIGITSRRLWRDVPRTLSAPLLGIFGLYLCWWTVNEGLYQRSFWLFLSVAAVITRSYAKRRSP